MKVGMVVDYPPKGATHCNARASYAKLLATSVCLDNVRVIVFANKLGAEHEYTEGNIKVVRCWDRGFFSWLQIFREAVKHRGQLDVIHIQHEYFYYGGTITAILFPLMLLLLRLLRKPIVVTVHGVIPLSECDSAFAKKNDLKGNLHILKLGLWVITKLICRFADKVIVHEEYPRRVLITEYGVQQGEAVVIPHGIESGNTLVDSGKSKKILGVEGKRTVMFFGYISGYKGLDILVDAFGIFTNEGYVLLIVGGENPRLWRNQEYRDYVHSLKEKASGSSCEIRFTGFIPEEEFPLYFSAADLIVFPHSTVMGASATLAVCIAYKRPFLLSEPFKVIINDDDLLFKNNHEDLRNKIEEFFANKRLEEKALKYVEMLSRERSWSKVGQETTALYRALSKNAI